MKAAITGATGLVGSNLAARLREAGHTVRCTRRASGRTDHLEGHDVEWVEADLGDADALARAFEGADWVFHCAAAVEVAPRPTPSLVEVNVRGTERVLAAVRRAGAGRLVHCSSAACLAMSDDGEPVDETHPWNRERYGFDDGYARTKLEAERAVLAAAATGSVDAVVVNPTYMIGPLDPKPSSGKLVLRVAQGKIPGTTGGGSNFVDVRDVARGMIAAAERGRGGERYILGHRDLPWAELTRMIAEVAGVPPPRWRFPRTGARLAGRLGDLYQVVTGREADLNSTTVRYGFATRISYSSAKATRELGHDPGPLETAIADALAWFRARGMLA